MASYSGVANGREGGAPPKASSVFFYLLILHRAGWDVCLPAWKLEIDVALKCVRHTGNSCSCWTSNRRQLLAHWVTSLFGSVFRRVKSQISSAETFSKNSLFQLFVCFVLVWSDGCFCRITGMFLPCHQLMKCPDGRVATEKGRVAQWQRTNARNLGSWFSGQLLKIVATRCHIISLKRTKFDFGWGSDPDPLGELTALPRPPS